MTDPILLQPHGLHSPDYTAKVGNAFSEAVRVLNYASGQYRDVAVPYPITVYQMLGELVAGAGGLDQLLRQLGEQLEALGSAGRLEVRHGPHLGDPLAAVAAAPVELEEAGAAADRLCRALQRAHGVVGAIGMPYDALDEDDR